MTTTLLVGARLGEEQVPVAGGLLARLKFERADPILDRYGLHVAATIDPDSTWWVWEPETGDAIYDLADDFDERWKRVLEDLLVLAPERRVYIAIAHLGDVTAARRFAARDWSMLYEVVRSIFSSTAVPADSCVIEYGPEVDATTGGGTRGEGGVRE